ncbi:MAG: hypothetical protein H7Y16_00480 [Candidatus Parcubacteria bacterium]|nr:hypothetical protein [Burkholderiales bacterium]
MTVTVMRDPVDKSYRKMVKGMDLFEEMRAKAPGASLRFKLLPRQPGTSMDGIKLAIDADSLSIPVPVRADNSFTLERNQKALDEDAVVASNRKALSMTWRAEIRTPGLPENTRRLGDLRLECHVGMEADLVSNDRPTFFLRPEPNPVMRKRGYCEARKVGYLFFAERPLFSVTLVSGARREVLSVDYLYAGLSGNEISKGDLPYCDCQVMLDRTYFLPLGDRSWPDDTLVEFEYMDEQTTAASAAGTVAIGSSKSDVFAALGKGVEIRFDSGYDEWIYRYTEEAPAKGMPARKRELVVLFAPSGTVAKTRLRVSTPAAT